MGEFDDHEAIALAAREVDEGGFQEARPWGRHEARPEMAHLDAAVGQHDGRFLDRLGRPLGCAADLVDECYGSASAVCLAAEAGSHGPVRAEDADPPRIQGAKTI